ncbi:MULTISPECIES: ribokinase [Brochothrix]|uniref:ribokinase n=1 Tax=Brochothrix TaxID=2755 RepID=UPI0003E8C3EE|nr:MULTISPECIES: ribokinase [Brochothrix]SLM96875.1 Ribokinase [Brachybacterium faecium]EUJ38490.1 ribokinase [Brochothrix thermosphacta DSM 20171 = FSL F6-1036]MBR5526875.1 ribokinase [Brochothrix sp.]ODJ47951.1 ribokinase [Brochothrix thermosphacta DSM 20171 = FSL F6-1036]ODJ55142.1 ribokinase [Brochothrix thermosphacta]
MAKVTVVGSLSIDLVVRAAKRPVAGETIIGEDLSLFPGGKGANQAVAAARLGATVTMVGCVGDDSYGEMIIKNLEKENVNTSLVKRFTKKTSGTAHITVAEGDNSIIVVKGTNDLVDESLIEEARAEIASSDIVMAQYEIPLPIIDYLAKVCEEEGTSFLLNPAPAADIQTETLKRITYLTPNENENKLIFPNKTSDEAIADFPGNLLVTLGEKGVRFQTDTIQTVPAFKVAVTDTTGAGDTFNGAFAVAIAEGKDIETAVLFGNAAAALSVQKLGAQSGMPDREAVKEMLTQ